MQSEAQDIIYDVMIIGAGPAGSACALALQSAGLKIAIMDKSEFPRDKVCGDAIPHRAVKVLSGLSPAFSERFKSFGRQLVAKSTTLHYKGRQQTFEWVAEAYTCPRADFDHFLLTLVKETDVAIITGEKCAILVGSDSHIAITAESGKTYRARIVVGADGAHSVVAKQLAGNVMQREHHVGSVRAYYRDFIPPKANNMDIYFDRRYLPSYLWVFPLAGNRANVGIGMLSSEIARRKVNLRKLFGTFVQDTPGLFAQLPPHKQEGAPEGFGLPLGSRLQTLSGERYLLAGDAASLVDPITGEGIGNAVLSGKLAAEQVMRCFEQKRFDKAFMARYESRLLLAIGKELRMRYLAQRLLSAMPFLIDVLFFACRSKAFKRMVQRQL